MTSSDVVEVGFWRKAMIFMEAIDTSESEIARQRMIALQERVESLESRIIQLEGDAK